MHGCFHFEDLGWMVSNSLLSGVMSELPEYFCWKGASLTSSVTFPIRQPTLILPWLPEFFLKGTCLALRHVNNSAQRQQGEGLQKVCEFLGSGRGRQQDASERQGQPGEDMKAGTSAPGESTVTASVADSEDAYSDAFNSSSSLQSEDVSPRPLG